MNISALNGAHGAAARFDSRALVLLARLPLAMAVVLLLGLAFQAVARAADPVPVATADQAQGAAAPAAPTLPNVTVSSPAQGAPTAAPTAAATLDGRIQDIKTEALELNRDLMVLEEELLFPANTQVAVFVSLDVGKLFGLDSVQVKLDDKEVANYLYTPAEVESLHRGGVQRLYLGNLRSGPHELVAFFVGKGPHDRDYRRATAVKFDKGTDAKYIELQIKDATGKLQPEFSVKVWQ